MRRVFAAAISLTIAVLISAIPSQAGSETRGSTDTTLIKLADVEFGTQNR